jgi:cell division protein FtsQ
MLMLAGFVTLKFMDPSTLPVRLVNVTGDIRHLSPEALERRAGQVVRGGFFNVNVEAIQRTLLEEPWVREVSVKRIWPDSILVDISEQTAVAQWGDEGLLNPDAVIFYPELSSFPPNLPVLTGPMNSSRQVLNMFTRIQALLPAGIAVERLSLSDRRSWQLKIANGPEIRLGKSGVIARMQRFLDSFPVHEPVRLQRIAYIDMRYTNGFAIRWHMETESDLDSEQITHGEEN